MKAARWEPPPARQGAAVERRAVVDVTNDDIYYLRGQLLDHREYNVEDAGRMRHTYHYARSYTSSERLQIVTLTHGKAV